MKTKYFACMCITYVPGSHRVQERASDTLQEQYDEDVRDYEEMSVIYHHEGFFWRCWFFGDDPQTSVWRYWFMNQPHPKRCIPGYLFPMQIAVGPFSHPSFDATAVYRGFWTIFIILGAASSLSGGFLLVYGVPFASAGCYKVGGGFLMISGALFSLILSLFVLWKEYAVDFPKYISIERSNSSHVQIDVVNGLKLISPVMMVPIH
ncbi:transmembrane protein 182-like isoform X3 [Peromyscus maniculatus bairdii]|uniref:transmembrane protein 182-like isoform X3 n=1 Tax=Peromyscus maniculatus bairdii TaxID=230844 RepID=UPI003FD5B9D5